MFGFIKRYVWFY